MIRNRRVVTGHDADGQSCVLFDSRVDQLPLANPKVAVVWSTRTLPASNEGSVDTCGAVPSVEMFNGDGAKFIMMAMEPGDEHPFHQTDTVDFAVVLSGRVLLTLEAGEVVLEPGDLVVDRGALHGWKVLGSEPALIAATIIPAWALAQEGAK